MFLTRLLVAATLAMLSCAFAQGISYTIQVVAVSDQESALNVQRTLLDDAFPAYVVRASVAQGDIYRVRVGSFANRFAAQEYAQAMPDVDGSRPLPALAEGIPEGIMPLEPRLLLEYLPESNGRDVGRGAVESLDDEPDSDDGEADDGELVDGEDEGGDDEGGEDEGGDDDEGGDEAGADEAGAENDDAQANDAQVDQDEDGQVSVVESASQGTSPQTLADVEVIAWEDAFALRIQPEPEAPATYVVPSVAGVRTFQAWRAAPTEAGVLRVRNLLLWSEDWQEQSVDAREEHRLELINRVARRVGTGPADIERLQRRPVFGPPYLVVLELFGEGDAEAALLGVAAPEGEPAGYGPDGLSVGDGQYPAANDPLFVVSPRTTGPDEGVMGEGWSVTPDERYFQVVSGPGGSSWRAGLGRPLWAVGSHLLTRDADRLLLYEFVSD